MNVWKCQNQTHSIYNENKLIKYILKIVEQDSTSQLIPEFVRQKKKDQASVHNKSEASLSCMKTLPQKKSIINYCLSNILRFTNVDVPTFLHNGYKSRIYITPQL